jgi:SHS2 domain-containing protein
MPYQVLSHAADTGIEATAPSASELLEELARGMFGLVAPLDPEAAQTWVTARVESSTLEDLVVDALSRLLLQSELEDLLFCDFKVALDIDALAASIEAGGVPIRSVEPSGPPIKAVTYHGLVVEKRGGEWRGRVYFDV